MPTTCAVRSPGREPIQRCAAQPRTLLQRARHTNNSEPYGVFAKFRSILRYSAIPCSRPYPNVYSSPPDADESSGTRSHVVNAWARLLAETQSERRKTRAKSRIARRGDAHSAHEGGAVRRELRGKAAVGMCGISSTSTKIGCGSAQRGADVVGGSGGGGQIVSAERRGLHSGARTQEFQVVPCVAVVANAHRPAIPSSEYVLHDDRDVKHEHGSMCVSSRGG
ncbi:hypothetical protein B0H19DRAFT_1186488 [Mycena capillaripes]|nr:hypothetical protein B0H19DRAFT_1186488 [Mycena capillaripes]